MGSLLLDPLQWIVGTDSNVCQNLTRGELTTIGGHTWERRKSGGSFEHLSSTSHQQGNKLGVLMLTAEQLAYIFPLSFMYKRRQRDYPRSSQEFDIWTLLIAGFVISVLLSQYWDFQGPIAGVNHSIGLLVLSFLTGAVCSSTGVVFTPYLASLPSTYTSAHTAGAGLSGLVVAALSLIADSGASNPRISVSTYFQILSFVFLLSILSFMYVHSKVGDPKSIAYQRIVGDTAGAATLAAAAAASETVKLSPIEPAHYQVQTVGEASEEGYGAIEGGGGGGGGHTANVAAEDDYQPSQTHRRSATGSSVRSTASRTNAASSSSSSSSSSSQSSPLWPIFTLQCLLAALAYGIVPSVLPLACSGYTDSSRVLMASTVGFMVADPLGKLATSFFHTGKVFISGFITICFAGILLFVAIQSPTSPPFSEVPEGGLIPIVANTLFSFTFSFTSISIFFNQSRRKDSDEAYRFYSWSAFMIQTGAVLGVALTLFFILFFNK